MRSCPVVVVSPRISSSTADSRSIVIGTRYVAHAVADGVIASPCCLPFTNTAICWLPVLTVRRWVAVNRSTSPGLKPISLLITPLLRTNATCCICGSGSADVVITEPVLAIPAVPVYSHDIVEDPCLMAPAGRAGLSKPDAAGRKTTGLASVSACEVGTTANVVAAVANDTARRPNRLRTCSA